MWGCPLAAALLHVPVTFSLVCCRLPLLLSLPCHPSLQCLLSPSQDSDLLDVSLSPSALFHLPPALGTGIPYRAQPCQKGSGVLAPNAREG